MCPGLIGPESVTGAALDLCSLISFWSVEVSKLGLAKTAFMEFSVQWLSVDL